MLRDLNPNFSGAIPPKETTMPDLKPLIQDLLDDTKLLIHFRVQAKQDENT